MKVDEFYSIIKKSRSKLKPKARNYIVERDGIDPIAFVFYIKFGKLPNGLTFREQYSKIGLHHQTALRIANAADRDFPYSVAVLTKLCEAFEVDENSAKHLRLTKRLFKLQCLFKNVWRN